MIYTIGGGNGMDNFGVDDAHIDPLTRARVALDFEALNQSAPPVKEILFKAQTMGPLAPVREAWRPRPATLALAFAVLLLAVPWLPQRSNLTIMQIGFEQELAQSDANKLAAHLIRNEPDSVLLQTEFTPSTPGSTGYNVPGHLRVHLTAFNSSEAEVEHTYREQINGYRGRKLDPMFRVDQRVEHSDYHSPALLALSLLRPQPKQELHLADPTQALAQAVSSSNTLLASAAAPKIQNVAKGIHLAQVGVGATGDNSAYDFTIPAWPAPMGFKVDGYSDLSSNDKTRVMSAAADFVRSANLQVPAAPAEEAGIQVTVFGLDGRADSMRTRLVQAWVSQPSGNAAAGQSESAIVAKAMKQVYPSQAYTADYAHEGGRTLVSIYLSDRRPGIFDQNAAEQDSDAGPSSGM